MSGNWGGRTRFEAREDPRQPSLKVGGRDRKTDEGAVLRGSRSVSLRRASSLSTPEVKVSLRNHRHHLEAYMVGPERDISMSRSRGLPALFPHPAGLLFEPLNASRITSAGSGRICQKKPHPGIENVSIPLIKEVPP